MMDFRAVARVADTPLWMSQRMLAAKDLKELIAWLKPIRKGLGRDGRPGQRSHLCGIYLQKQHRTRFQLCPIAAAPPPCRTWLRAGRHDVRHVVEFAPACACRPDQGLAVMAKSAGLRRLTSRPWTRWAGITFFFGMGSGSQGGPRMWSPS